MEGFLLLLLVTIVALDGRCYLRPLDRTRFVTVRLRLVVDSDLLITVDYVLDRIVAPLPCATVPHITRYPLAAVTAPFVLR